MLQKPMKSCSSVSGEKFTPTAALNNKLLCYIGLFTRRMYSYLNEDRIICVVMYVYFNVELILNINLQTRMF